jgi:hypothetical protein
MPSGVEPQRGVNVADQQVRLANTRCRQTMSTVSGLANRPGTASGQAFGCGRL